MKYCCSFLIFLIILTTIIFPVQAEKDITKQAENISVEVPITGNAILGTPESMYQYNNWLIECAYQMISLFNQVVDLLNIPGMEYTKKMQDTLEVGMKQAQKLKMQ